MREYAVQWVPRDITMQRNTNPTRDEATPEPKPDALTDEQLEQVTGGTNSPQALRKQQKPGGSVQGVDVEFGIDGTDW